MSAHEAVNLGMPAYGFEVFAKPSGEAMRFWYACEEAERPPDPWVMWHYRDCFGCALKANAAVLQWPDDTAVQRILGPIALHLDELAR